MTLERELTLTGKDRCTVRFWLGQNHLAQLHHRRDKQAAKPHNGTVDIYLNLFGRAGGSADLCIRSNGRTLLEAAEPAQWQVNGEPLGEHNKYLPAKSDKPIWLYKFPTSGAPGQLALEISPYSPQDLLLPDTPLDALEQAHGQVCYVVFPHNINGRFNTDFTVETAARTLKLPADEPGSAQYVKRVCKRARENHEAGITWYRAEIGGLADKLRKQDNVRRSLEKQGHL